MTSAPSGTFETGDGKLNIAANKQEQFEQLCEVLNRPDLLVDERFATRDERKAHREQLRAELEKSLARRSAVEWDQVLLPTGMPGAPVISVPDALQLDPVQFRELVHTVPSPDPDGPDLRVLGGPVHVDGRPSRPLGRDAADRMGNALWD